MTQVAPPSRGSAAGDYTDFYHTGPNTLAGRWWRTFWHPVCRLEDLQPGQAKPLRVMSEDFTLYRGESGTPHVVAFRCAHRGTQLSTGWVEGEELRCFYHGWKYDSSGQCVEQPAEPQPFCDKIRIRSYPTEEYLGLIFVHLGDGESPPLPRYADFEVEPRYVMTHVLGFNVGANLDGHPDHGHIPFVHGSRTGRAWRTTGDYGLRPVLVDENEWGTSTPDGGEQHGVPNIIIHIRPPGESYQGLRWRVPIDDDSHSNFTVYLGDPPSGTIPTDFGERAAELAEAILRGERCIEDVEGELRLSEKRVPRLPVDLITITQDYVSQKGLGSLPVHSTEHLGREDAGLILKRKIWEGELRALAEGRPLTRWVRPERLWRHSVIAGMLAERAKP